MNTFKVIDKATRNEISAEDVSDYAGAFFGLADSGHLFTCWRDAWGDYELMLMDSDDYEVIINETRTL